MSFPPAQPAQVVPIPSVDVQEDMKLKEVMQHFPFPASYGLGPPLLNLKEEASAPAWDMRCSPQVPVTLYPFAYDLKVPDLPIMPAPMQQRPVMADLFLQRNGADFPLCGQRSRSSSFPQSPPRKRRQYFTPYSPSEEKEGFEKCLRSKVFGYMFVNGHPKHLGDNVERFMEDLTQLYFQQANHNKCDCAAGWKSCECEECRVCLLYQHVKNRGLDDLPYSELCPCPSCIYAATSMFETMEEKKQALVRLFQKHRFHLSDRCNCKPPPPKVKRSGQSQCLLDLSLSRLESARLDTFSRLDTPLSFWVPGQFMY